MVLTIPEAVRLQKATGLPAGDFLEFSCAIDPKETPHYPLLVKQGGKVAEYFIVIKRRRKVDCSFLDDDLACTIYTDRPHVCRLYPFELDGKEQKKGALCPVKFAREAGTEEVAAQLKKDLLRHGRLAREWVVAFGGRGTPDMKKFREYFGVA